MKRYMTLRLEAGDQSAGGGGEGREEKNGSVVPQVACSPPDETLIAVCEQEN